MTFIVTMKTSPPEQLSRPERRLAFTHLLLKALVRAPTAAASRQAPTAAASRPRVHHRRAACQ
eukprot:COSAG06_NODE_566_length_14196_cov_2.916578_10_plen_63_part_00